VIWADRPENWARFIETNELLRFFGRSARNHRFPLKSRITATLMLARGVKKRRRERRDAEVSGLDRVDSGGKKVAIVVNVIRLSAREGGGSGMVVCGWTARAAVDGAGGGGRGVGRGGAGGAGGTAGGGRDGAGGGWDGAGGGRAWAAGGAI